MKPLVLKMTAFGPYAEETVIDFRELNQGIYLVTGDTGAGKTTIFDAIVFALYGEGSGSGRGSEMFHSDYVDKFLDTKVELLFLCRNKQYRVERTIHYKKKRGGGVGGMQKNAYFYAEGELPIEKETVVNAKVAELLGLDKKQFCQIVMLAQGEFGKFLEAKSDAREQILGKLFDNRLYKDFQERIRLAAEELRTDRSDKEHEISYILSEGRTAEQLRNETEAESRKKSEIEKKLEEEYRRTEKLQKKYRTVQQYRRKKQEYQNINENVLLVKQAVAEKEAVCAVLEKEKDSKKCFLPQIDECKHKLQMADKIYEACRNLKGRIESYRQQEEALAEKQMKWKEQQADYEEAVKKYTEIYRRFLAGQAGVLAEELRQTIEEKGSGYCPVCGQEVSKETAHLKIFGKEEIPSQEEVERAAKQVEMEQQYAVQYAKNCEILKNTMEINKNDMLDEAYDLFGEFIDWQSLSRPEEMEMRMEEQRLDKEKTEQQLKRMEKEISDAEQNLNQCRGRLENLRGQLKTLQDSRQQLKVELEKIEQDDVWLLQIEEAKATEENLAEEIRERELIEKNLQKERDALLISAEQKKNAFARVQKLLKLLEKTETAYQNLSELSLLVNGQSGEGGKYSFSRYVLGSFFEEILIQANVHLDRMTGGKYELLRQQEAGRKNESAGLGIVVLDAYTGEQRETASLSGGESFQVSLSLALGLSDVVRQHSGGYTLDAMFIDEGFGALDEQALEQAMEVLGALTEDGRQIGIISHVGRLSETITNKLYVRRTPKGSSVEILKR